MEVKLLKGGLLYIDGGVGGAKLKKGNRLSGTQCKRTVQESHKGFGGWGGGRGLTLGFALGDWSTASAPIKGYLANIPCYDIVVASRKHLDEKRFP